jgi:hypothetical protein
MNFLYFTILYYMIYMANIYHWLVDFTNNLIFDGYVMVVYKR